MTQGITEGRSSPFGATLCLKGANFSVYSKHAMAVELLLFDGVDDARAARVIRIDASTNRTYHYWHVFIPGVRAGQIYSYRVDGPYDPSVGMIASAATLIAFAAHLFAVAAWALVFTLCGEFNQFAPALYHSGITTRPWTIPIRSCRPLGDCWLPLKRQTVC